MVQDMLDSFQTCVGIPVQVLDEGGRRLIAYGARAEFCTRFSNLLPQGQSCEQLHQTEALQAAKLGKPHVFSCHANLNHVVYPLLYDHSYVGAVLIGPFLFSTPDSISMSELAERYTVSVEALLNLYDGMSTVPVITPSIMEKISKLLFYLFSGLIAENCQQMSFNGAHLQTVKVSETIKKYKFLGGLDSYHYPYDKEKALVSKLKSGDMAEIKAILNDLLGYVLFWEGHNLDDIKARAMEITSLLSRAAIEGGGATDALLKLNHRSLLCIGQSNNFDLICRKLQEIVEAFTETAFQNMPPKNTEVVAKAMGFISQNYAKKLTLESVANYIHLNPSYFSTLFSQSVGTTFKEYLNMVRVEEAKRLLMNTKHPIINIAMAVGFEDQSYFSKVFKKFTGFTPKQYR